MVPICFIVLEHRVVKGMNVYDLIKCFMLVSKICLIKKFHHSSIKKIKKRKEKNEKNVK